MISGLPFKVHWVVVIVCCGVAIVVVSSGSALVHRRRLAGAVVASLVVFSWPLDDLATHVSLSAAVIQRLAIILGIVPLVMYSIDRSVYSIVSQPRILDRLASWLSRPIVALLFVTIAGAISLDPASVDWSAGSVFGHFAVECLTVVVGVVLWLPMTSRFPTARRLSDAGRAGYFFVSSIVVTSLSFVWIFSRTPMYPGLSGQRAILGISPIVDQQGAGYLSKLLAYAPMWAVAFVLLARSAEHEDEGSTLYVEDALREHDRAQRSESHRADLDADGEVNSQ